MLLGSGGEVRHLGRYRTFFQEDGSGAGVNESRKANAAVFGDVESCSDAVTTWACRNDRREETDRPVLGDRDACRDAFAARGVFLFAGRYRSREGVGEQGHIQV